MASAARAIARRGRLLPPALQRRALAAAAARHEPWGAPLRNAEGAVDAGDASGVASAIRVATACATAAPAQLGRCCGGAGGAHQRHVGRSVRRRRVVRPQRRWSRRRAMSVRRQMLPPFVEALCRKTLTRRHSEGRPPRRPPRRWCSRRPHLRRRATCRAAPPNKCHAPSPACTVQLRSSRCRAQSCARRRAPPQSRRYARPRSAVPPPWRRRASGANGARRTSSTGCANGSRQTSSAEYACRGARSQTGQTGQHSRAAPPPPSPRRRGHRRAA